MELCQLNRLYVHTLVQYNRVLLQRNKLLKEIAFHPEYEETLDIWDLQLLQYGTKLMAYRAEFIGQLNPVIGQIHSRLSGNREQLVLTYEPNVALEMFEDTLKKSRTQDLKQKTTLTGPHRDDISFWINGIDIRKFGSQGQQRTAALSLKLAEIELVKQLIHDHPILLLDDVLSELDRGRQNQLLSCMEQIQTIITCTGLDDFVHHRFHLDHVFRVHAGQVTSENEQIGGCL